jgi:hypothetical protein
MRHSTEGGASVVVEPTVAFNAADYDRLIGAVRDLINHLGDHVPNAAGTLSPPDGNWLLQPDGQVWETAANLVDAGKSFGSRLQADATTLLSRLQVLYDALCSVRAVFSDVGDLATCTAKSFASEFPQLRPCGDPVGGAR